MFITFLPQGGSCQLRLGENLLAAAIREGQPIDGVCGGQGRCGSCKVRIAAGDGGGEPDQVERELLTGEELGQGWRLACRLRPISDLTVELPQRESAGHPKEKLLVFPEDFRPEASVCGSESPHYGIAFDLGTTTAAGMLWNLKDGSFADGESRANPQRSCGADVISRIQWWGKSPENRQILREQVISCFNQILTELQERNGIDPDQIVKGTLVGNTAMIHLFLGKDPTGLAIAPFHAAFEGPVTFPAGQAKLRMKRDGDVYVPPHIGGQVGADLTAVLLATRLSGLPGNNLAVDVGTNGEILLASKGRVFACSTAAGPAFEGAALYQGMRAETGAVESVSISRGKLKLGVIGGGKPRGICGSGAIDGIAGLLSCGLLDSGGRMRSPQEAEKLGISSDLISRLFHREGAISFVLDWKERPDGGKEPSVMLTQKDVRELQLAKGAIRAGIEALMRRAQIKTEDLSQIFLAGAFGIHISPENVLRMNMLPQVSQDQIVPIGNGAGAGASMMLLSQKERKQAEREAGNAIHVELSCEPGFQEMFLESMEFCASVEK